ncbi:hypothetical protein B0H14DRAFT_3858984 [Mycena olivaceomarginata]|nr:hypothetical protein B0H14DRAFT_3858984 [Mycena olivaceomarginata]
MARVTVPPSSSAIDPQYPRENPALFTRVLTIYDNRWWRDENERKGGMSTAGSQRITTDDTLRDEVAGDGGRGDGIERVKTGWFAVLVAVPAVNELIEKMREGWAEKWNTLGLETEHVEVQCSNLSDNGQRMKCSTSTIPLRAHDFVALNAVANLPLSLPFEVSDYVAWQG